MKEIPTHLPRTFRDDAMIGTTVVHDTGEVLLYLPKIPSAAQLQHLELEKYYMIVVLEQINGPHHLDISQRHTKGYEGHVEDLVSMHPALEERLYVIFRTCEHYSKMSLATSLSMDDFFREQAAC